MKLQIGGYGGEFTIGTVTDAEVKNIKALLRRFDPEFIFCRQITIFGIGREYFSEFTDIYSGWGPTEIVCVEDIERNTELNLKKIKTEKGSVAIELEKTGFYLISESIEKGSFCTIEIDVEREFESFDADRFRLIADDLTGTWIGTTIISGATYYDVDLELNYDNSSTKGVSFDQTLAYYDEDTEETINGIVKLLESDMEKPISVISEIPYGGEDDVFRQYLDIVNNAKYGDDLNVTVGFMMYLSPIIEEMFGIDECIRVWMQTPLHIKTAKEHNMIGEVPQVVMNKIITEKPEWLI